MSYWNIYTKDIISPYKLYYKYNKQYNLDLILNLVLIVLRKC